MDQTIERSAAAPELETPPRPEKNVPARIASKIGIVGIVLVVGVLALLGGAIFIAATTPDFMPDDFTDDPFVWTGVASLLPGLLGFIGLGFGITALGLASMRRERRIAIRGLVLGILNIVLSIAILAAVIQLDQQVAACGGG